MTLKYKLALAFTALVVSFGFGRYSVQTPAVKTIADSTANTDTTTNRDTHRETTTTTEKDPSGTVKTTTKIVEDTTSKKETDSNVTTHLDQTVTPQKINTLNVSALVGMDLSVYRPVYGASVSKQFLGPISVGAFGLTNSTLGVSLGVSF